jgi:hypothetical protein
MRTEPVQPPAVITEPVQLAMIWVCDVCGGIYGPGLRRHKPCIRALDTWISGHARGDWTICHDDAATRRQEKWLKTRRA